MQNDLLSNAPRWKLTFEFLINGNVKIVRFVGDISVLYLNRVDFTTFGMLGSRQTALISMDNFMLSINKDLDEEVEIIQKINRKKVIKEISDLNIGY